MNSALQVGGAVITSLTSITLTETVENPYIALLGSVLSALVYGLCLIVIKVLDKKGLISKKDAKSLTEDLTDDGKINGSNIKKGE